MARKYTTRVNIPMDDELREVYQSAADALDMELTTWMREWMREGVPMMRAIVESRRESGVGPLQAYMRKALGDVQTEIGKMGAVEVLGVGGSGGGEG